MDKYALVLFYSVLNKVKNGFGGGVLLVKNDLVLQIQPLKSQVDHTAALPMVGYLLSCAVDDVSDLVCHNELLILGGEAVADEEPVFDLDGTDHVLRKAVVHERGTSVLGHDVARLELLLRLGLLVPHPHHFLILNLLAYWLV